MKQQFEVNWTNFATKFYEKEQKIFEILCYHLFCQEFNAPNGLFRYKNQAGIETDPVLVNSEWVGFQSKYYEETTKISDKKDELIDAIKKAKRKNPQIAKLIFYTNKEFSESSTIDEKEPQYKKDIEMAGTDKGVKVEWKVKSHFEILLAKEENRFVYEYFFQIDGGIWSYTDNIKKHTDAFMNKIEEHIPYGENIFRFHDDIYRDKMGKDIFQSNIVVVSGDGGVGKTAFIKHWMLEMDPIIFAWKAIEFNVDNIQRIFSSYGNYTLYDFIEFFKDEKKKYVLIDSAERLLELEREDVFEEFLGEMLKEGWKVILTVRTTFLENIKYIIKRIIGKIQLNEVTIPRLDVEMLKQLAIQYSFHLPQNTKILDLLCIPFYLNEYLKLTEVSKGQQNTVKEFKEELWKIKIMGYPYTKDSIDIRRKQMLIQLVKKKLETQAFYVKEDKLLQIDYPAISELKKEEIIDYDDGLGYFIAHDIYEEWTLEHIIENLFLELHGDYVGLFQGLGTAIAMRRSFRQWLLLNLEDGRQGIEQLLRQIIMQGNVEKIWKDEVYITILNSKYCYKFYEMYKANCINNNGEIFYRMIFLLRIAEKNSGADFLFSRPKGYGWGATIQFLYHNIKELIRTENQLGIILDFLEDWNRNWNKGEITKLASKIACKIYEDYPRLYSPNRDKVEKIMLMGAVEINDELSRYVDEIVNGSTGHDKLAERALTSFEGTHLVKANPIMMINLAKHFWMLQHERDCWQRDSWESSYGLNQRHSFEYHPQSAYQTPIFWLLREKEKETLEFIIDITNLTIKKFVASAMLGQYEVDYKEICIKIDGKEIRQHCSSRIWQMYRGTQTGPGLLQCVFAALEKWLIEISKEKSVEEYEDLLKWLIINSKSAAITAIVVSAILANPDMTYNIVFQLLNAREIFVFDRIRASKERSLEQLIGISALGARGEKNIYIMERQETMKEEFRKRTLDLVILRYQMQPIVGMGEQEQILYRNQLYDKFDCERKKILRKKVRKESDTIWELYLSQMDLRRMQVKEIEKDGNTYVALVPELDTHIQEMAEKNERQSEPINNLLKLKLWAEARYKKESEEYLRFNDYEQEPIKAYDEMLGLKDFVRENPNQAIFAQGLPLYISCILIRDFRINLEGDQINVCKKIILYSAIDLCKYPQQVYMYGMGSEAVIEGLIVIMKEHDESYERAKLLITHLLITKEKDFKEIIISHISKLPQINILYFMEVYLGLQDEYHEKARKHYYTDSNWDDTEFWEEKDKVLQQLVDDAIDIEQSIIESSTLKSLTNTFAMIPMNTQDSKLLNIAIQLINSILKKAKVDDDKAGENFEEKWGFWERLAEYLLYRTESELAGYIDTLNNSLDSNEWTQRFLNFLIIKEDNLKHKEVFWQIWNGIYSTIYSIVVAEKEHQIQFAEEVRDYRFHGEVECENIITEYMLASYIWKENANEWYTLDLQRGIFYEKICTDIGFHRAVLHGVAHVLNSIGIRFENDGIEWISTILQNNPWMEKQKLLTNTLFYLERYVVRVIKKNQTNIKSDVWFRKKIICILDFMVEQGSVVGFMLRDGM